MKNISRQILTSCGLVLLTIILIPHGTAFAGSDVEDSKAIVPAPTPPPKEWDVRIGLPGWLLGLNGESGVKGVVGSSDITFSESFHHLTHVPLVLSLDLRYRRWEFFGDGQYQELGDSATLPGLLFTTANIHIKDGWAEAFLGYRVIDSNRATVSLFAGARYNYEGINLSILDNGDARLPRLRELLGLSGKLNAEGSIDWVDPVIGARGKVKLWKAISLYAEGDIGGFDANSDSAYEIRREGLTLVKTPRSSEDWTYQAQGGLEIQVSRWYWMQVGWRWIRNDFVSGGFTSKVDMSGPLIQGGVNF